VRSTSSVNVRNSASASGATVGAAERVEIVPCSSTRATASFVPPMSIATDERHHHRIEGATAGSGAATVTSTQRRVSARPDTRPLGG